MEALDRNNCYICQTFDDTGIAHWYQLLTSLRIANFTYPQSAGFTFGKNITENKEYE